MDTEQLTVFRGGTDKYGNPNKRSNGTVDGVFAWTSKPRGAQFIEGRGEMAEIAAELYVERDADLKPRDRIARSNGEQYRVVGHSMWNQDHPMDGFDFGWKIFLVEAINGK